MKGIVAEVMCKFPYTLLGLYSKGTELPQFLRASYRIVDTEITYISVTVAWRIFCIYLKKRGTIDV